MQYDEKYAIKILSMLPQDAKQYLTNTYREFLQDVQGRFETHCKDEKVTKEFREDVARVVAKLKRVRL